VSETNERRSGIKMRTKKEDHAYHANIYVRRRSKTGSRQYTVATTQRPSRYVFATTDHDEAKMVRDIVNVHFHNGTFDGWYKELKKYKGKDRLDRTVA